MAWLSQHAALHLTDDQTPAVRVAAHRGGRLHVDIGGRGVEQSLSLIGTPDQIEALAAALSVVAIEARNAEEPSSGQ